MSNRDVRGVKSTAHVIATKDIVSLEKPRPVERSLSAWSKKRNLLSGLSFMDTQFITYIGVGVIVSVAIFVAFKAGQVSGFREQVHNQSLDLEKLKLKIEYKILQLLEQTSGNAQLPEGFSLQQIIESMVLSEDCIEEKILTFYKIYLDLVVHGHTSDYFLMILN